MPWRRKFETRIRFKACTQLTLCFVSGFFSTTRRSSQPILKVSEVASVDWFPCYTLCSSRWCLMSVPVLFYYNYWVKNTTTFFYYKLIKKICTEIYNVKLVVLTLSSSTPSNLERSGYILGSGLVNRLV